MQVVWLQLDSPLKKSSPCIKMWVCKPLWKKWHGEAARREIIFPPPRPGHNVLSTIKQHPWVRTSSFAVFHIHLALLPLAPWPAIGHTRRVPHQRGSGLDSHLQWRSRRGLKREKRFRHTQHRVELVDLPRAVFMKRSVRPLYGAPPYTPDGNGNVRLRRHHRWYRST